MMVSRLAIQRENLFDFASPEKSGQIDVRGLGRVASGKRDQRNLE